MYFGNLLATVSVSTMSSVRIQYLQILSDKFKPKLCSLLSVPYIEVTKMWQVNHCCDFQIWLQVIWNYSAFTISLKHFTITTVTISLSCIVSEMQVQRDISWM